MSPTTSELAKTINAMEFDHVFTIHPDGSITEPHGIYAPSVYHDDETDIAIEGADWSALRGLTLQDRYYGACMHASEYIGTGIAGVMWQMAIDAEEPVTFALVVVECLPEDDDEDPEPAGWAIMYRDGAS
jgi:hypothetical protein